MDLDQMLSFEEAKYHLSFPELMPSGGNSEHDPEDTTTFIRESFAWLDGNKDGQLNRTEVIAMQSKWWLVSRGWHVTFQIADQDKDGRLTRSEMDASAQAVMANSTSWYALHID